MDGHVKTHTKKEILVITTGVNQNIVIFMLFK